jgi:hypothetical protein
MITSSKSTSSVGGVRTVAIPSEVSSRRDLTIYDKLCYGALGFIAKGDYECSPTPREITKVLGIGKRKSHKIRRALLHLTSLELIQEIGKIMLPGETVYRESYHIIPPQQFTLTFLSGATVLPHPSKPKPDPATLSKTRICIQCGIERPSTNFEHRNRRRKSGSLRHSNARRPRCRKCRTYNHVLRMQLQPERDGAPARIPSCTTNQFLSDVSGAGMKPAVSARYCTSPLVLNAKHDYHASNGHKWDAGGLNATAVE